MKNPLSPIIKFFQNSTRARLFLALIVIIFIIVGAFFFFQYLTGGNGTGDSKITPVSQQRINQSDNLRTANQQYVQTLLKSQNEAAKRALETGQTEIPSIVSSQKATGGQGFSAKAQHQNKQASKQASASGASDDPNSLVNQMAQDGNISKSTAQKLKKLNNENLSPEQYKKHLQKLVREGKISPAQAKKLEQAYNKKHGGQSQSSSGKQASPNSLVSQMAKNGNISKSTAQQLKKLNGENLSPSQYKKHLQKLVREGKISPAQAKKLEQAYNKKHGGGQSSSSGSTSSGSGSTSSGSGSTSSGSGSSGSADNSTQQTLAKLKNSNLSPSQFSKRVNALVQQGKLSPDKARQLIQNHTTQSTNTGSASTPANTQKFKQMYQNGVTPVDFAKKLNEEVKNDQLTAEKAEKALENYKTFYKNKEEQHQASQKPAQNKDQRQLQKDVEKLNKKRRERQKQQLQKQEQKLKEQSQQKLAEHQKQLQEAMSKQMKQLIKSWKPSKQKIAGRFTDQHKSNSNAKSKSNSARNKARSLQNNNRQGNTSRANQQNNRGGNSSGNSGNSQGSSSNNKKPSIRAGDIMFAVLDTGINTDKQGPVMASIVSGKFRGAKLMGKLSVTKDHEGVKVKFNRMIMPHWRSSQPITALAIDPETAHTALATSVNHHYLVRFGSVIASSFLEGVGKAVKQSGKTQTTSQGQTVNSFNDLNATQSAIVGLGEVGKKMSSEAKKEFKRKPTVKVKAGTGLGILFMKDTTLPKANSGHHQPNAI